MNIREKLVKDSILFLGVTIFTRFIFFIKNILLAKYLGVDMFGIWSLFLLILSYGSYAQFGVLSAVQREIPISVGKKDFHDANKNRNVSFTFLIVSSIIYGFITFIFLSIVIHSIYFMKVFFVFMIMFLFQQVIQFCEVYYRTSHSFKKLSIFSLINIGVSVILVWWLVIKYKLIGAILSTIIGFAIAIIYFFKSTSYRPVFDLDITKTISLIKIGMPIVGLGIMSDLMYGVDRFFIPLYLGVTALGIYSYSYVICSILIVIQGVFSQVIYPRMAEKYGAFNEDYTKMKAILEEPVLILAYFLPISLVLIIIAMPIFTRLVLPQYVESIKIINILIIGIFFSSLCSIPQNILVISSKFGSIFKSQFIIFIFNLVVLNIFLKLGFGLIGASWAIVLGTGSYSMIIIYESLKRVEKNKFKLLKFIFSLIFPMLYILIILYIINKVFSLQEGNINILIVNSIINFCLILFLAIIPLLISLNKKTRIVFQVWNIFISVINNYFNKEIIKTEEVK